MTNIPRAQEIYKHFKGNVYQIVTVAEHTETEEKLVVYQAMYGDFKVYARPLSMFMEKVDKQKYPEATQEYRFEKVTDWVSGMTEPVRMCNKPFQGNTNAEEKLSLQENMINQEAVTAQVSVGDDDVQEPQLDPLLLDFLDADTYEEKLNILAALHHRITDDMITTMAIASDVEVEDGDLETRYSELKNCLLTLEKYEINRI